MKEYSIEWFKELRDSNPTYLGTQALELLWLYEELEEQKDDLLNKLVANEELYISRGMEIVQLVKKNEALMKLAGMYIKSYEDLVFGDAEYEDYEIGKEEVDDE